MTSPEVLRFYATPSATSLIDRHAELVAALPSDPVELGKVVRGLLVHNFAAKVRGMDLPPERLSHMETVGADGILDKVLGVDGSALDVKRPADRRMVGFCYHFALLHCALLRTAGTPARVRCGFAGYFVPDRWIDHWVVEHWDGEHWRRIDPQIGRVDLHEEDFRDGVTAWLSSRGDPSTSSSYGNGELWGWDELRGSLINDVAALNKVEVAGWYWCQRLRVEPLDRSHDHVDSRLDAVAHLAAQAKSVEDLMEAYHLHPDLQPPSDAVAK